MILRTGSFSENTGQEKCVLKNNQLFNTNCSTVEHLLEEIGVKRKILKHYYFLPIVSFNLGLKNGFIKTHIKNLPTLIYNIPP